MSQIRIIKAKLNQTKQGTGLILTFEEIDDQGAKITAPGETFSAIVHPDILEQYKRLGLHFAVMAGYVKAGDVEDIAAPDPALSEGFHVKGFSIGGNVEEGTDGVILSGSKVLPNGKSHNFNTPFYRFKEGEGSRYAHMDDLIACLTVLEREIILYKKGDKRGTPVQPEIFPAGTTANPEAMKDVAQMENTKPAKGGKGKKKEEKEPVVEENA